MYGIGILLIFLGVKKKYEPALLIPLGFGAILVNLPEAVCANGIIRWLFDHGIESSEAMPILLFIGIGAMIDFGPLMKNPVLFFCGFFAQAGIFIAIWLAAKLGFARNDAISIGIIGAADGPTAIFVSRALKSQYAGQIALAAYSYIALIPIIQPIVAKITTTRKERSIKMGEPCGEEDGKQKKVREVPKWLRIVFPIAVTFICGFISPRSAELVGFIMFGNLIKECGVLNNLAETARTTLTNLITILLGLTISFTLRAQDFVQVKTLMIMAIGLFAFVCDTASGILFVKLLNLFRKKKINPLVGMAGVSAFPIASHVAQREASTADPGNIILMQAAGANVAGQICSAMIGGWLLM